jgi:hypothetical protein
VSFVCVLWFFFALLKNYTALIPGTTVEILDMDSKNIIQLIVNAYNVSKEHGCFLYECEDCRKDGLMCGFRGALYCGFNQGSILCIQGDI